MRPDRRRRPSRRVAAWMARRGRASRFPTALVVAASCATALTLPAVASAGAITLQSTYAGPIAASNQLCTAEPRALLYGTTNFDPLRPLTHRSHGYPDITVYEPANAPSALDLSPAVEAGGRSDLCLGFTLPPNVEPKLVRDWFNDAPRLQDDPAWPDHAETHVSSYPLGSNPVQGDDLRTLSATLPAGYSIDFAAAARCSEADFGATSHAPAACPAPARVGDAFLRVNAYAGGTAKHATITAAALYNLAPQPGELGRLGLTAQADPVLAPSKWVFTVRLATDGSGRLVLGLEDAPRSAYDVTDIGADGDEWDGDGDDVLVPGDPRIGQPQPGATARPLYLESVGLRPWGAKAAHGTLAADFGTWGTRCEPALAATLGATTYAGTGSSATTAPFALADCGALALPATMSVDATSREAGAPTGATVTAAIDQVGVRAPAVPTSVAFTLPDGLELGPQLASGDEGQPSCSAAQFGSAEPQAPSACPPAAAIGSLELSTPLAQTPFTGVAYLAPAPTPEVLAGVFVDLALPAPDAATAPRLKLTGTLAADDAGRVTITLDDLPDLRFDALQLTLRGGDHALLTNPRTCGTHTGGATLERDGAAPTQAASNLTTDEACGAPGLEPSLEVAATTARSAGRAATSLALRRADRSALFERATFVLPAGALLVPGAIPECSAEGAAAGDCPASAQVGSVRVRAGAGSAPAELKGELYLAPAPDGAFAGGVIVVPARLGAVDLGAIVAPVRFDLRSGAATLVMSVSLPDRLRGVRLDLRELTVDLDRDGVVRQPTACGPLDASATVSSGSREATSTTTVAFGGCGALPFDPGFAAGTSGSAAAAGRPKVSIAVTPRGGDAALRSAAITFPAGYALDPKRSAGACTLDAFNAGACGAAAKVGQASGKLAIAPDALGGDAVLVRLPGEAAPGLGLTLAGRFGHRALGRFATDGAGRLVLSFPALVDLPLSRLAVVFDGGNTGALHTVPAACPRGNAWVAQLTGHGGQSAQRQSAAACASGDASSAVSPVAALSLSKKTGLKLKLTQFGSLQLQAAKLTLPKLMRLDAPKAKRGGRTSLALIGAKATPTFTRGSLTLQTYGGAPTEVVARVRTTAYALKRPAKKARKKPAATATFQLRLAFKDGSVQTRAIKVKLP